MYEKSRIYKCSLRNDFLNSFYAVLSHPKAKKLLKWKPTYDNKSSFTSAIQETIDWYSDPENLEKFKSNLYNL